MDDVSEQLGSIGIIPIVVLERAEDAEPLARALLDGGLPCAEITFRTDAAEDAIRTITTHFPDMLVGAGTVLTTDQAERATSAGAKFIITPGFDADVVDWCVERHIPIISGVMTPTEIMMALRRGLNLLKFFPAETAGGIRALRELAGPFKGAKFIPSGGITAANLADYLREPVVRACGGSWVTPGKLMAAGQFERIAELAAEAVAIVKQVRQDTSEW